MESYWKVNLRVTLTSNESPQSWRPESSVQTTSIPETQGADGATPESHAEWTKGQMFHCRACLCLADPSSGERTERFKGGGGHLEGWFIQVPIGTGMKPLLELPTPSPLPERERGTWNINTVQSDTPGVSSLRHHLLAVWPRTGTECSGLLFSSHSKEMPSTHTQSSTQSGAVVWTRDDASTRDLSMMFSRKGNHIIITSAQRSP